MRETRKTVPLSVLLTGIAMAVQAGPSFNPLPELDAVPDVTCRIYFARMLDSVNPQAYAFEARSRVGRSFADRWEWTPGDSDAGKSHEVILNAWNDDGLVASMTTTVRVVRRPTETNREITLALLAASGTNCRYPDHLRNRMKGTGFVNYRPVGSHTGGSSSSVYEPDKDAAHDGYGGFSWRSFIDRYALSVDEIDNVQAEAEREQLRQFGEVIPEGQEWRRALLKSPLVRLENGRKVVDIPRWFDRINGGKAPDYIVIALGGNVIWNQKPWDDAALADELACARQLIGQLRKAAPNAVIGLATCVGGSLEQEGWARNYNCAQTAFFGHRAFLRYNRAIADLVTRQDDPLLKLIPVSQNVDPIWAYPRGKQANALHVTKAGGEQIGDAFFAWLLADLENGHRQSCGR